MSEYMTYTTKLDNTIFKVGPNPAGVGGQALNNEIDYFIMGLKDSCEKHWGVDTRGKEQARAFEAVARWIYKSFEAAEKEVE